MTIVYRWKLFSLGSQPPWLTPRNRPEQVERVDAAAPGDAVLAVGREGEVVVAQRPAGADLGGLLAEQAGPDAQLALALQGGGLGVEPADQHQVAVQPAQLLVGDVDGVRRVLDPLALGGEQLDELGLAGDRRGHRDAEGVAGRAPVARSGDVGAVGHGHSSGYPAVPARGRRGRWAGWVVGAGRGWWSRRRTGLTGDDSGERGAVRSQGETRGTTYPRASHPPRLGSPGRSSRPRAPADELRGRQCSVRPTALP